MNWQCSNTITGKSDQAAFLFCDLCDLGFHMSCVDPKHRRAALGEQHKWFCPRCAGTAARFGLDGGDDVLPPTRGSWTGFFVMKEMYTNRKWVSNHMTARVVAPSTARAAREHTPTSRGAAPRRVA